MGDESPTDQDPLRDVDANLLVHLDALLTAQNLTKAAETMTISPSAMSRALRQLRLHFGDELLVKSAGGFTLTGFAEQLRPVVTVALDAAGSALANSRGFDPAASQKQFTVSVSEYAMTVLAEPLHHALAERAPLCGVTFDSLPLTLEEAETLLLRRDLIVGPLGFDLPGDRQPVFTDQMVCVVSAKNARVPDGLLSVTELAVLPHATVRLAMAGVARRPLDTQLARVGLSARNIQMTVSSLLAVPYAISGTDLVGFIPKRLALRCQQILGLRIVSTPLDEMLITEAAHWHPRRAAEPANIWLRELLYDVAVELEDAV